MSQKKILVLCGGGEIRSPLAARLLNAMAKEMRLDVQATHGAVDAIDEHRPGIHRHLDYSFCMVMEEYMARKLCRLGVPRDKIVLLDVSDAFESEDRELQDCLAPKLRMFLHESFGEGEHT